MTVTTRCALFGAGTAPLAGEERLARQGTETAQSERIIQGHKWESEPEIVAIASPYLPSVNQSAKPVRMDVILALESAWTAILTMASDWEALPGAVRFRLLQTVHDIEPIVLNVRRSRPVRRRV